MRRAARSALAVVVGFVAATFVFQAAGVDPLGVSDPVVLGDLDVDEFCREEYGSGSNAMLVGAHAFSWQCSTRPNDVFQLEPVDFDQLCVDRFGAEAESHNWNADDPHAWECVRR